jgi:glycosyltransferase involved in cell wall biosynthesis
MHVVVPIESRFAMKDGQPVSRYVSYDKKWKDYGYLDVFDSMTVLVRVSPEEDPRGEPAEGPGVKVVPLPMYVGPVGYMKQRRAIREIIRAHCPRDAAYMLYLPGLIGTVVWRELLRTGHPYGIEVVGDPYDSMAPGGVRHPLRPLFRYMLPRDLKRECQSAVAAAYVTKTMLQQRYPCPGRTWSISNIILGDEAFVDRPRQPAKTQDLFTLVHVGHMSYLYKAQHILIDAVAKCVQEGLNLRLVFCGEGQRMDWLKQRAARNGIVARVDFKGGVPIGEGVRRVLDDSDVFVLPSFQEGLPRAMVEAMARALPCIGSTVGGFPELLPAEYLVPPGDAEALARTIKSLVASREKQAAMSRRNLEVAREFHSNILRARRVELCQYVKERTQEWLATEGQGTNGNPHPRVSAEKRAEETRAPVTGS